MRSIRGAFLHFVAASVPKPTRFAGRVDLIGAILDPVCVVRDDPVVVGRARW